MDERKRMSSGEIKWKWRISPVTGDLWGIKLIKWLGSGSQVKDLECPKTIGFGAEWVLELNYHPCWDRKMSVSRDTRTDKYDDVLAYLWAFGFPCGWCNGVVFLWIWWWLKRLANLWLFTFFFFFVSSAFSPMLSRIHWTLLFWHRCHHKGWGCGNSG